MKKQKPLTKKQRIRQEQSKRLMEELDKKFIEMFDRLFPTLKNIHPDNKD